MSLENNLIEQSQTLEKEYIAQISIDCVIFGFHDASLKVLLLKVMGSDSWMLPGGYIKKEENMDTAANRVLQERTGVQDIFLNQFKVFGETNRTDDFLNDITDTPLWHKGRFISIGYYALVDYSLVTPIVDFLSDDCKWVDIDDVPDLLMDHNKIIQSALYTLRQQINFKPVGLNLLPEKFTLPELQSLYEVILNKKLNRGSFYRKIMKYDILDKLDEIRKGGAHKAPNLYKFNKERYAEALEYGFREVW